MIQKIELSRFTKFFGIAFSSGIPVNEAIEIGNNTVNNSCVRSNIAKMNQDIAQGLAINEAMYKSNHFPSIVIRMFKVGENSGSLTESIKNINYFFDHDIQETFSNLTGLLQPIMIGVMGVMFALDCGFHFRSTIR